MSDQELLKRFEELEAGRILGDLDAAEAKEWEDLSKDPRCQPDLSLELAAAAIESNYLEGRGPELPDALKESLHHGMAEFITEVDEPEQTESPSILRHVFTAPQTAWAIAALFAILFIAKSLTSNPPPQTGEPIVQTPPAPDAAESLKELEQSADDLIRSDFDGIETYAPMSGSVVWSDERQEGYMTLTNLPANDPSAKQYQLWIVDPARDEKPVDGGVFDIPADGSTTIIPIKNPLAVRNPQAFVITLEQPGGVVVSKQEEVVALAKTS